MTKNKNDLKSLIESDRVLIADGAMTTSLYERGFYINRSFEELSISSPEAVREVVRGFKKAGAQLLHTNTFNCTRPKLTEYGLQDELPNIIKASVQIAREVSDGDCFVLGLLGPLGKLVEPLGPTSLVEAEEMFYEVAQHLAQSGVDGFAINSIQDFNELECAIRAVKRVSRNPLFVNVGIHENLKTSQGHSLEQFAQLAEKHDLDVIGFCGEVGPSTMLTAVEALRPLTNRPIMLLPNAGLPRFVNDQYIYLCNPDYLGKFAKRYIQAGARIVGGHSGVYENHIKAISNAARMADHSGVQIQKSNLPKSIQPIADKPLAVTPLEKRSALGRCLKNGEKIVSVELVPPGLSDFGKFDERCSELSKNGIKFVNIPDGARAMARISSLHLAAHVQKKYSIEAIPHFTCRDRNLIGLQSDLLGAQISGVNNILLVTGDPPKLGNNPGASAIYDVDAIGLTHIVSRMNRGLDIGGSSTKATAQFVIGVALNPTSRNMELEISRFNYKVEAGCDYAITQPIYNVDAYQEFMDKANFSKTVPIIMGIWPLVSLRNAEFLKYEVPGVDVPDWVIEEMKKAGDSKEDGIKRGIEIALRTIEKAKNLVAGFQVSAPFNKAEIAIRVIKESGVHG